MNKMRYRGTPCQFFFLMLLLCCTESSFIMKWNWTSLQLTNISSKWLLKHFIPLQIFRPVLQLPDWDTEKGQTFLASARHNWQIYSRQKWRSGWQQIDVFLGFLSNFTKCQMFLVSARLKASDKSGKCQIQVNISSDLHICARRSWRNWVATKWFFRGFSSNFMSARLNSRNKTHVI